MTPNRLRLSADQSAAAAAAADEGSDAEAWELHDTKVKMRGGRVEDESRLAVVRVVARWARRDSGG